jgi:hypothetical protein
MLGPSIMVGSTPLALGYSLYARARVQNRPLIYIALGLAVLAALVVASAIIASTIDFIRR